MIVTNSTSLNILLFCSFCIQTIFNVYMSFEVVITLSWLRHHLVGFAVNFKQVIYKYCVSTLQLLCFNIILRWYVWRLLKYDRYRKHKMEHRRHHNEKLSGNLFTKDIVLVFECADTARSFVSIKFIIRFYSSCWSVWRKQFPSLVWQNTCVVRF